MAIEYFSSEQITEKYDKLSAFERCRVLYEALDYMQQYNGRTKFLCIAMAMGYRNHEGKNDTYIKRLD